MKELTVFSTFDGIGGEISIGQSWKGYTACISSESARKEAIGNGWTINVIAHIFEGLKEVY